MLDAAKRAWPSVRAAGITLLLGLGFVAGWPEVAPDVLARLPQGLSRSAQRIPAVQQTLLAPFAPLAESFGISTENWKLFSTTGGMRNRLWVEARGDGDEGWVLLHRALDDEHAYLQRTLEYRRLRALWNPHRYGLAQGYVPFTHWLARRIFLDFPSYDRVRIRQEQLRVLPEGAGFRSTGRFGRRYEYSRHELLP